MASLFVEYLAICNNENLPNNKNNCPRYFSKLCHLLNKRSKDGQNGEISPNMVTLQER